MIYTEDLSVYNYIKHFFYTGYDNEKYDGVINVYKKYNEVHCFYIRICNLVFMLMP